ncbi:MAG: enoyl-ACP reductase [Candidatus Gastranaerophilales bacterium]|nr:enoyl-ACP reductase [Candidatus Gastranaerophilales bacterium]
MGIMEGKKGIIFGVSNKFGIANAIAEQIFAQGGELAFTYANEAMEKRVRPIAESMNAKLCLECDVTKDEDVKNVFDEYAKVYDRLDFVIHAVAFANKEDLMGDFYTTTKEGWDLAMHVSAYSLLTMSKYAKPQLEATGGGSILALTYLGSTKSVANYNIMGVAKAALESSMRFIAADLGKYNIRCNCLSAGPVKTMAAKGIGGFDRMLKANALKAPLKRTPALEDVGKAGMYLVSDLSSGVTGSIHFVDCGAHSVFASLDEMELIQFNSAPKEAVGV